MDFIRMMSVENQYWDKVMDIYRNSFPIFEQRDIKNQISVLEDVNYNCIAVCDRDLLVGLLFYWEFDKYIYIEHLGILGELRGKNYGSKILRKFCKGDRNIILEIDPPIDDLSIKRLKFYNKLGFLLQDFEHIHPPYRRGYEGHNLKIMSYNRGLSTEEYEQFNFDLKEHIMMYSEYGELD